MYYLHYLTLLTITATVGADILLENNDTEIGLIFRARELEPRVLLEDAILGL
jgi:hypothetical protein